MQKNGEKKIKQQIMNKNPHIININNETLNFYWFQKQIIRFPLNPEPKCAIISNQYKQSTRKPNRMEKANNM